MYCIHCGILIKNGIYCASCAKTAKDSGNTDYYAQDTANGGFLEAYSGTYDPLTGKQFKSKDDADYARAGREYEKRIKDYAEGTKGQPHNLNRRCRNCQKPLSDYQSLCACLHYNKGAIDHPDVPDEFRKNPASTSNPSTPSTPTAPTTASTPPTQAAPPTNAQAGTLQPPPPPPPLKCNVNNAAKLNCRNCGAGYVGVIPKRCPCGFEMFKYCPLCNLWYSYTCITCPRCKLNQQPPPPQPHITPPPPPPQVQPPKASPLPQKKKKPKFLIGLLSILTSIGIYIGGGFGSIDGFYAADTKQIIMGPKVVDVLYFYDDFTVIAALLNRSDKPTGPPDWFNRSNAGETIKDGTARGFDYVTLIESGKYIKIGNRVYGYVSGTNHQGRRYSQSFSGQIKADGSIEMSVKQTTDMGLPEETRTYHEIK